MKEEGKGMRDGFFYKGKHCEQMEIHYAPGPEEIRKRMEDYKVNNLQVAGRDGGYYFGSTVNERVFELDCFFVDMTEKQYAAVQEWLRRDEGGELIFDDRPYVVYDVWPTKTIQPTVYLTQGENGVLLNGKMKITLTAYSPFGRMKIREYSDDSEYGEAMEDTGVLPPEMTPAAPGLEDKNFLIYNPGTEKTPATIRISGDVGTEGLVIRNSTNGTACKIIGMSSTTMPDDTWLEFNAETGQVLYIVGDERRLAYEYHDLGYLQLDPCTPIVQNIVVNYEAGSRVIRNQTGMFVGIKAGQYIYLEGQWRYISQILDAFTLEINTEMENSGMLETNVVTMNRIILEGECTLKYFEVDFEPRTR